MTFTPLQREERRRRAIEALARGLTQKQVAKMLETSVASVSQWKTRFNRHGAADLAAKPTGRPPRLASGSAMDAVRLRLLARPPEGEGLHFGVWDGRAVAVLMERVTDMPVSRWTVLRYLNAWHMAPPEFETPPRVWLRDVAPDLAHGRRPNSTPMILQGGRIADRPGQADGHWLLWARRPRGEWSFIAYPRMPSASDAQDFVERLLIKWPARLSLVALPDDPLWTAALLARCAARWPGRLSIVIPDGSAGGPVHHQKKLVTLS